MFLHAKHAAIGGSKSINIVSSDTDVVVIGVAVFDDLNVDHLWMTFGKGKDLRWIPIHDIGKFFEYTDFTLCQIVTWRT
jgi:hypothetical protein